MRAAYLARLVGRCVVLLICLILCFAAPAEFDVLDGMNFFDEFSLLHILWVLWIIDMFFQLVPARKYFSLGSQKVFSQHFKPIRDKINHDSLKKYIVSTTRSAYKIFLIWTALTLAIGALYLTGTIDKTAVLMFSVFFYVCDLICVLIWCPFRLILKNRCCTTCRIFNWDHLMMFSPLFFIGGFYAISLCVLALLVWCIWELCILMFPERFWEYSNEALKCSNCTDKLCTQYCQKLR